MAKRKAKRIQHKVFHDLLSSAEHEERHQKIREKIIYEARKENVKTLLVFLCGTALGVLLTISVLKWIMANI